MEDITYVDQAHAKSVCKDFEIKNLGEYCDLYNQNDPLLLAVAYEYVRNMCVELSGLDFAKKVLAPGSAWQAALKMNKVK